MQLTGWGCHCWAIELGKRLCQYCYVFPFGLVTYPRVESSGLLPRCQRSCSQCFGSPMVGKSSGSLHPASHMTCNSLVFTMFSIVSPFITVLQASPTQYPPFHLLQGKSSSLTGIEEGLSPVTWSSNSFTSWSLY